MKATSAKDGRPNRGEGGLAPDPHEGKRGYTMHRLFKDRPSINVEYEKLYNLDKIFAKKMLPIKSCIRSATTLKLWRSIGTISELQSHRAKFGVNALEDSEWESRTRTKPFFLQGLFFK